MSCQQIREVMSLPPDPPHVNNNNYICLKYCPKGLDHLSGQTPSSNFKEELKERFVASLFETVERDCGNEYWATRDSPATHAAVSPLPCCTFGNTKPGKVYRLAAWFLPVVPDTIPQTVANPSIQRFEFPVYRSLFEVVQPSTHQQV